MTLVVTLLSLKGLPSSRSGEHVGKRPRDPTRKNAMTQSSRDEDEADDAALRAQWRTLVDETLPKAAWTRQDWPVFRNHCFARILLDNACGIMWRDAIAPPAWRNTPLPVLQTAIDLGEDVLLNAADIWALNDASLRMRGKRPHGRNPASRQSRRTQSDRWHGRASQARRFDRI